MRSRVRWGNLARAAAALLVAGLIVAWPRLAPPDPSLPGGDTMPLGGAPEAEGDPRRGEAARGGGRRLESELREPPGEGRRGKAERRERRREGRRGEAERRGERRRGKAERGEGRRGKAERGEGRRGEAERSGSRRGRIERSEPAPPDVPARGAPPVAPQVDEAPAPAPDPAQAEFGFERAL